jgi:hypothetical protein
MPHAMVHFVNFKSPPEYPETAFEEICNVKRIRRHQASPQPDFWLRRISTSSSFQCRVKEASLSTNPKEFHDAPLRCTQAETSRENSIPRARNPDRPARCQTSATVKSFSWIERLATKEKLKSH